jgi:hypothetical protein
MYVQVFVDFVASGTGKANSCTGLRLDLVKERRKFKGEELRNDHRRSAEIGQFMYHMDKTEWWYIHINPNLLKEVNAPGSPVGSL